MLELLKDFIWSLAFSEQGVSWVFESYNSDMLTRTLDIQIFFDEFGIIFQSVRNTIYLYSYYLIILKFVKKILDVYALQTDGDANADIFGMITNFCKAMVIAMSFTTVWSWVLEIAVDFGKDLTAGIDTGIRESVFNTAKTASESSPDASLYIILPIFIVLGAALIIVQLKNAFELWILRLGVPLACCGLMDADQGIYRQYKKLIVKAVLTIIFQIFLLNVGCYIITFIDFSDAKHACWLVVLAIMAIGFAFTIPKLLSEFLIQNQGDSSKVMQTVCTCVRFFLRR